MPKKTKYRKVQKGRLTGISKGARTVHFGEYGLQAMEACRLTAQQIESMRVAVSRNLKKVGSLFLRVFPDKPVTKKPAETRMGRGKGPVEYWVSVVRPGNIIFEVSGVSATLAREAMRLADGKLPFRSRFISREELEKY